MSAFLQRNKTHLHCRHGKIETGVNISATLPKLQTQVHCYSFFVVVQYHLSFCTPQCTDPGKAMCSLSQQESSCQPGRKSSLESKYTCIVIINIFDGQEEYLGLIFQINIYF